MSTPFFSKTRPPQADIGAQRSLRADLIGLNGRFVDK